MAARSGDVVGYLRVLLLVKLTSFDPMLMGRLLTPNPFLTDTDILTELENVNFFFLVLSPPRAVLRDRLCQLMREQI